MFYLYLCSSRVLFGNCVTWLHAVIINYVIYAGKLARASPCGCYLVRTQRNKGSPSAHSSSSFSSCLLLCYSFIVSDVFSRMVQSLRVGEMAQWLLVLAVHPEDPRLAPSSGFVTEALGTQRPLLASISTTCMWYSGGSWYCYSSSRVPSIWIPTCTISASPTCYKTSS